MKHVGTGQLFVNKAKRSFMEISGSRYDSMAVRLKGKGLSELPFTKDQFRAHILSVIDVYDGFAKCRYCEGYFTLSELAADHEAPLSRGGLPDLHNIGFPCAPCNARKGSMFPEEYLALLQFLEREIPMARIDVLKRLQISVQSAAGGKRNQFLLREARAKGFVPDKRKKKVEEPF